MQLSIEQIGKIIDLFNRSKNTDLTKEFSEALSILKTLVLNQTNFKSMSALEEVFKLYNSTKSEMWFRKGLENVLLNGKFPENVIYKEIKTTESDPWKIPTSPSPLTPYKPLSPIFCNSTEK